MRRREFIALCSSAAIALPLAARAQQSKSIARIGFLGSDPDNPLLATGYSTFIAELRKLGFAEGENLIVERGRIDEGADKAFASAADVIRSKADVVVAFGPEIALEAAVAASRATPIVMIAVNYDPIAGGYVNNITRPDKNITGLVARAPELAAKQLELLVEAFPNNKTVAALWDGFGRTIRIRPTNRAISAPRIALAQSRKPAVRFRRGVPRHRAGRVADGAGLVRPDIRSSAPTHRRSGDPPPSADDVHLPLLCRGWRLDVLWHRYGPRYSAAPPHSLPSFCAARSRPIFRSNSQQFRIQPELENRKSDRRLNTDIDPAARRSGNRIARLRGRSAFFALTKSLNSSCPHLLRSTSWCAIYEQRRGWPEQVRP